METITIYEKSTCTKCRAAIKILDKSGVEYRKVLYHDTTLTKEKLTELIKKLGFTPRELLRIKEPVYAKMGLIDMNLSDSDIIDLMLKYPDLIQRPILERGDRAIIGRPPERINEFLNAS